MSSLAGTDESVIIEYPETHPTLETWSWYYLETGYHERDYCCALLKGQRDLDEYLKGMEGQCVLMERREAQQRAWRERVVHG